jgi:O-antigen/teichoic acid export membrane protein
VSDNSFVKKFIKNVTGFSVGTFVNFGLGILILPISTYVFKPEDLGSINLFITYYMFFTYFCYLGLDQAFVRFYHETNLPSERRKLFSYCLKYSLIITGGAFVFICFLTSYLSEEILGYSNIYIGICLGISLTGQVILRYCNLLKRMECNIVAFTVQALLMGIGLKASYVLAGIWKDDALTAIVVISVYNLFTALVFIFYERKEISFTNRPDRLFQKSLFQYSIPLVPITLVSWLNSSLPQLLLNKLADISSVGIYTNAANLAAMVSIVKEGFANYWMPFVYENYKTEQEKMAQIHHIITFITILTGLLLIMATDIIYFFIGKSYQSGKVIFPILIISPILLTILNVTDSIGISIAKKNHLQLIAYTISAIVNIGLSALLMPLYGILGAAAATALSSAALLGCMTVFGRKYYRFVHSYKKMILGILLLVCAAILNGALVNQFFVRYGLLIVLIVVLIIVYRSECIRIAEFIRIEYRKRKKQ